MTETMMKRLAFVLAAALLCGVASAQDAFFKSYANVKGVSTVYVSRAMFGLMPDMKVGGKHLGQMARKIDQLRVLTCERPSMAKGIAAKAQTFYTAKHGYEPMMQVDDDGDHTTIYMKRHPKGKNEFVLLSVEDGEVSVINVLGGITLDDIAQITR